MTAFNVLVSRDGGVTDRHVQSLQDVARLAAREDQVLLVSCERADERTIRFRGPWTDVIRDAVIGWMFANQRAERDLLPEPAEPSPWWITCEFLGESRSGRNA